MVAFNKAEGRKMTTLRDRSGQTYKAPVFLVINLKFSHEFFLIGWRRYKRKDHNRYE